MNAKYLFCIGSLFRAGRGCLPVLPWLMLSVAAASDVFAQTFPSKPIRLIVNFPPGGGSDILARNLSPTLSTHFGQQVVVDNRPGAAGNIGADLAAKAPADGYTVLLVSSSHAANVALYKELNFHPINSFAPVVLFGASPQVLMSKPGAPFKSIKDLIALARSQPGKLNFASAGSGSTTHLAGELLKSMAGINLIHVPYKGGGPALTELIGGHVDMLFLVTQTALPQIRAGRLPPLAVTSVKRVQALPQVPTIAESGLAGYEAVNWYGILAPAGTPATIIARLHAEFIKTVRTPETRDWMSKQGMEVLSGSPAEFGTYLQAEITKWSKVVKDAGLAPN